MRIRQSAKPKRIVASCGKYQVRVTDGFGKSFIEVQPWKIDWFIMSVMHCCCVLYSVGSVIF